MIKNYCRFCPDVLLDNDIVLARLCIKCKTCYYYDNNDKLYACQVSRVYNEDIFWLTWNFDHGTMVIRKTANEIIATFSIDTPITPHNFLDKLPTILIFL